MRKISCFLLILSLLGCSINSSKNANTDLLKLVIDQLTFYKLVEDNEDLCYRVMVDSQDLKHAKNGLELLIEDANTDLEVEEIMLSKRLLDEITPLKNINFEDEVSLITEINEGEYSLNLKNISMSYPIFLDGENKGCFYAEILRKRDGKSAKGIGFLMFFEEVGGKYEIVKVNALWQTWRNSVQL